MFNNKLMVNFWQFLSVSMLDAVKREQSCRINRTHLKSIICLTFYSFFGDAREGLFRGSSLASPFGPPAHRLTPLSLELAI